MMRLVVAGLVLALVGCKSKSAQTSSGSGSGSAAVGSAAPPEAAKGTLELESDDKSQIGLAVAFDHKVPKLPAMSADGKRMAYWSSDADGPMPIEPISLTIEPLGGGKAEHLDLIE